MIAVNQGPLGKQGRRIRNEGKIEVLKVRDLWKHEDIDKYKGPFTGKSIRARNTIVLLIE